MASARDERRRTGGRDELAGQGLVEFALIFVLVVIVAVVSPAFFGTAASDHLSSIGTSV
jgi:hypothetical protein